MKEAYLGGPWNEYLYYWKDEVKKVGGYLYYDPEIDSPQGSPQEFFPADLEAIKRADFFIGVIGKTGGEACVFEAGYFYATHQEEGKCKNLAIVWPEDRKPDWALEFLSQAGYIFATVDQVTNYLRSMRYEPDGNQG